MSPTRKRSNTIAGVLMLGGVAWVGYPLLTGESRMQEFCASLSAGALINDVRAAARQRGYSVTEQDSSALIHATSSFGRFVCRTEFKDGELVSSTYWLND
jgi:hypothetical protein